MSIGYVLGIPNGSHAPATDRPNMTSNNDNIATYVGIDHVPFNTTGSGQHEQVTFAANNVPGAPTTPPVLFTNTVGSLPQLFFYSGSSTNQYTNGANGSTFLLGGMILKWGQGNANSGGGYTNNFVTAFPNGCYCVIATSRDSAFTGQFSVTSITASSFVCNRNSGSGVTGIYFVAIGY